MYNKTILSQHVLIVL